MSDPYGNAANQYGQEMQFGVRLADTLGQRQAEMPNQLFDRFMQAYQMQVRQKMLEQQMAQQQAEAARKAQHEDTYLKIAQANQTNAIGDDIYNQYSGDPQQAEMYVSRLEAAGVPRDRAQGMLPKGSTVVPDRGEVIGQVGGADIPMPQTSADIQQVPGVGGGYKQKLIEAARKAAADRARQEAGASGLEEKQREFDARMADIGKRFDAGLIDKQQAREEARQFKLMMVGLAANKGGGGMTANEARQLEYERKQGEAQEKRHTASESIGLNLDEIDRVVGEIERHPGIERGTGATGLVFGKVPGTDAYDFTQKLDTLKNQIALSALKELRASSKTGGGVGNVSDRDIDLLKNSIDSLGPGQSIKQFKESLKNVRNRIQRMRANLVSPAAASPGSSVDNPFFPAALKDAPQDVIDAYRSGKAVTAPDGKTYKKGGVI